MSTLTSRDGGHPIGLGGRPRGRVKSLGNSPYRDHSRVCASSQNWALGPRRATYTPGEKSYNFVFKMCKRSQTLVTRLNDKSYEDFLQTLPCGEEGHQNGREGSTWCTCKFIRKFPLRGPFTCIPGSQFGLWTPHRVSYTPGEKSCNFVF